jgi:4-hydroxy-3-methylbut-2-enyl diphosphate reductase
MSTYFAMQSSVSTAAAPAPPRTWPKIIRARHLGMCFGVRDAIDLALRQQAPVTILGDLVHNEAVLRQLRARGIQNENQVTDIRTASVMITAHGASEQKLSALKGKGLNVIEATCPLVHFAHRSLKALVEEGFHPIIIGKAGHVEVRGMTEDLEDYDMVQSEADIARISPRPRFGIVSQTTQPIERVRQLVRMIRERFPASEVRFLDTVCQPTKQRQNAAIELAQQCDVVVVVGGAHSNNTRELVATCRRFCPRVFHVQSADGLRAEWFYGARAIGLTAGTSTPDESIEQVEGAIERICAEAE